MSSQQYLQVDFHNIDNCSPVILDCVKRAIADIVIVPYKKHAYIITAGESNQLAFILKQDETGLWNILSDTTELFSMANEVTLLDLTEKCAKIGRMNAYADKLYNWMCDNVEQLNYLTDIIHSNTQLKLQCLLDQKLQQIKNAGLNSTINVKDIDYIVECYSELYKVNYRYLGTMRPRDSQFEMDAFEYTVADNITKQVCKITWSCNKHEYLWYPKAILVKPKTAQKQ